MKRTPLMLVLVLAGAVGCSGSDVKVLAIDDGSAVGALSPSLFGGYRDMVIGTDDTHGKVAVIEWGDKRSTLKIVTIKPWNVSKQSVDVGRLAGLDGPMNYDFHHNRLVYATDMYAEGKTCSLVTIELNGDKPGRRTYSAPVPKGYIVGEIVSASEGMFFAAGNTKDDYLGFRLYRTTPDSDTAMEIFHAKA